MDKSEQSNIQITKKFQSSLLLTSVSTRLVAAFAITTCLWIVLGQIL